MSEQAYTRPTPRTGNGVWQMVAGTVGFAIGLFLSTGASETPGLGIVAIVIMAASAGLLAAGFWCRLFHLLEQRLIDVEAAIRGAPQAPPPRKPAIDDLAAV